MADNGGLADALVRDAAPVKLALDARGSVVFVQAEYTHKKGLFLKGLDDLKIVHNDPEGAYYVMLDISEFGYESDLQFCEDLASKVGVGAVPGSSFFREPVNHLIRLHFAKKDETLTDALNRLESLREKIPAKG